MRVLAIYGNPKSGGFVHDCIDAAADHLENSDVDVDRLHLADANIKDCTGCFTCLQTGECVIDDDMANITRRIREADGLVCGCSVRNATVTSLFKRLYERISFTLIFTGDITDKYVLGISAVGLATGKKATRRVVAMVEPGARTVDHLFFRAGIPTKRRAADVRDMLVKAADKLVDHITLRRSPGLLWRIKRRLDRAIMRRFMFNKRPEFYANVIRCWRERGWMK